MIELLPSRIMERVSRYGRPYTQARGRLTLLGPDNMKIRNLLEVVQILPVVLFVGLSHGMMEFVAQVEP